MFFKKRSKGSDKKRWDNAYFHSTVLYVHHIEYIPNHFFVLYSVQDFFSSVTKEMKRKLLPDVHKHKNVNVNVRFFFARRMRPPSWLLLFVWLKIKHPEKKATTNGKRKGKVLLINKKEAQPRQHSNNYYSYSFFAWDLPNSRRRKKNESHAHQPTQFLLLLLFFVHSVLLLSVSNISARPVYHHSLAVRTFFFYLWMKQNIDFLIASSSSFPQAFMLFFPFLPFSFVLCLFPFLLCCYSFFLPNHFSPFFSWINTLFQTSERVWISRKRCWIFFSYYETLNKKGGGKKRSKGKKSM